MNPPPRRHAGPAAVRGPGRGRRAPAGPCRPTGVRARLRGRRGGGPVLRLTSEAGGPSGRPGRPNHPIGGMPVRCPTPTFTFESKAQDPDGRPREMATTHRRTDTHQPADVLVVFGISGDLAKVMTFRSLYRLERRGLLSCPIVGVAVDDWSTEELRQHARKAIEATGEPLEEPVFDRFAGRLSYLSGDFGDPATYGRVGAAIGHAQSPV